MVGVPSSTGCEACRKQKKGCVVNETIPCTRCDRLKIPCIGYGQRRLTFKQEYQTDKSRSRDSSGTSRSSRNALDTSSASVKGYCNANAGPIVMIASTKDSLDLMRPLFVDTPPANSFTSLLGSYTDTLAVQSSTSSYNLLTSFGTYFIDIPQRLGYNIALDAAADALVAAYSYYRRTGGRRTEVACLRAYGRGLKALRECLNSVETACEIETLFAIMTMFTTETLIGVHKASGSSHSRGAAQVMKHRGSRPPASQVEIVLLLHLRAPVVVQAAYLPYDYFSDAEWNGLVLGYHPIMANMPEDATFQDLGAAIRLFQRARRVLFDHFAVLDSLEEMQSIVSDAMNLRDRIRTRISKTQEQLNLLESRATTPPMQMYQTHSWDLIVAIILNVIISALCGAGSATESSQWLQIICDIADLPCMPAYRPLGTFWLQMVLYVAYIGAEADEDKRRVWVLLQRYSEDLPGAAGLLDHKTVQKAVRYWRMEVGVLETQG